MFASDWFAIAFGALLGFLCKISFQGAIHFSTLLVIPHVIRLPLNYYKCISIKYRLHENKNQWSCIPLRFPSFGALKLVNDLDNAEYENAVERT